MQPRIVCLRLPAFAILGLVTPLLLLQHVLADEARQDRDSPQRMPELRGVLEAVRSFEIMPKADHLGTLKVSRLLPHGTSVSESEPLAWLDGDDIDGKIKAAEIALLLARLAFEEAEFANEQANARGAIERNKAERALAQARQAYQNFVGIDRERQLATAQFDLVNSRASLENVTEELEQLQQMYQEDDLTEESEEIVLKRAKQAVENAKFRLEGVEIASDRVIKQTVPNAEADQEDALACAELAYTTTLRELEFSQRRRAIELQKARHAVVEGEEKLAELQAEVEQLILRSPGAGIMLHGKLTRGRLGDKPSKLDVGSAVAVNQVVLTVVDPRHLRVRVDLDEKQLASVKVGDRCKVSINGSPEVQVGGEVVSISLVPYAETKYDWLVKLTGVKQVDGLQPLMTCCLTFDGDSSEVD